MKDIFVLRTPQQYNPNDNVEVYELGTVMYLSNMNFATLDNIWKTFKISSNFGLISTVAENTKGYFAVYLEQLKARLRIPFYYLFVDIMNYWGIELGHIAPNRVRQVVSFILICKAFGLLTNLEVFRKIFDIKPVKEGSGWHTFQKKNGSMAGRIGFFM